MRPNGEQSCSANGDSSLKQDQEELKAAHIPVMNSRKANDGKMYIQMCGAPTGSVNAFLIPKSKLPDALALGYKEMKNKAN
jgi:hypothetical protein